MDANRRAEALARATPETWVVLSEDEEEIVAESDTFEGAAQAAKENGMEDPVLLFVPKDWTPRVLWCMCAV
jgi:ABC-type glycerol-3-phosphate transport system substrate-binding protein